MTTDKAAYTEERFLILSRSNGQDLLSLQNNLLALGGTELIIDIPEKRDTLIGSSSGMKIFVSDEMTQGYEYLMSNAQRFSPITGWSRAFAHLTQTWCEGEAVWFVEDDVAGDATSFRKLVKATAEIGADFSAFNIKLKIEAPKWPWWQTAEGFFGQWCQAIFRCNSR